MGNIFNHNRTPFTFRIDKSEYWDFHLSLDGFGGAVNTDGLTEECLSAYIDTNDDDCVYIDKLFSKGTYKWENIVNKGLELSNIGLTGIDNGFIYYDKTRLDNTDFIEIFTNSQYKIDENETRFTLNKIRGNNQIFEYDCDFVNVDDIRALKLNGGFYQGFFKSGCGYQLLPTNIGHGWSLEFTLKKDDSLTSEEYTLNDRYPDNKGIFFYIGTRAENKWWNQYSINETFERISNEYFSDDYAEDEYINTYNNVEYFVYDDPKKPDIDSEYFADLAYISPENCDECWTYSNECKKANKCKCVPSGLPSDYLIEKIEPCDCLFYVRRDYIQNDIVLDPNTEVFTTNGHSVFQPNITEFESDNKFLLFDRTCDGFTTENWVEGSTVLVTDIKASPKENYFLLYDRTCHGLTTDKPRPNNKEYNVLSDLYRNAFALQITDNGSIGYKYLVQNSEEENDYKILSEFSKENIIKGNEWVTINVKIVPIGKKYKPFDIVTSCDQKMQLYFYVNGKLVFISKELPTFNFKSLNDTDDKQEGVPFNISLGGGTQGLCDVVYYDFRQTPKYVLPLEKEFGGSFLGYFKSFKFYDCTLNLMQLANNSVFEQQFITRLPIYN